MNPHNKLKKYNYRITGHYHGITSFNLLRIKSNENQLRVSPSYIPI